MAMSAYVRVYLEGHPDGGLAPQVVVKLVGLVKLLERDGRDDGAVAVGDGGGVERVWVFGREVRRSVCG